MSFTIANMLATYEYNFMHLAGFVRNCSGQDVYLMKQMMKQEK